MLSDSPPERDLQWTDTGISASFKFLNKIWDLVVKYNFYKSNSVDNDNVKEMLKEIINNVTDYIETFQFNKSVAKIYEYVNIISGSILKKNISKDDYKWALMRLSVILQPFMPHLSEEIWEKVGFENLCINQEWPIEKIEKKTKIKIAIQINGKTRDVIEIDQNLEEDEIFKIIEKNKKVEKNILNKEIKRKIYVPGKIVNIVI